MPAVIVDGRPVYVTPEAEVTGTTPVALATAPHGVKLVLRKLIVYNSDASDHVVELVEVSGGTVARTLLRLKVVAGQQVILGPDSLPADYVVTTDPASPVQLAARLEAAATSPVYVKAELLLA